MDGLEYEGEYEGESENAKYEPEYARMDSAERK